MSLFALRIRCTPDDALELTDKLETWPGLEPLSIAAHEITERETWEIEAHFDAEPDAGSVSEFIANVLDISPVPAFAITPLEDRDWVRLSLEGLKPVQAGRFFVHGRHDRHLVPPGSVAIEIDAGQAFGTGHHESTMGCLLALQGIAKVTRPTRILDVGTGSGVLAFAAAKLLKTCVMATDNDTIALEVARRNATANGVAPLFRVCLAQGVRHPDITECGPYGLILANILARPLARLAGDITAQLARGGHLVLSGILSPQANGVAAAYQARGLRQLRRINLGDWTTLIMRK